MDPLVSEAVSVLERSPSVLRSLLDGLPEEWLGRYEGEDAFGPREVLGHLIHGERTDWVPRIQLILEHGDAEPFVPFDRRGYGDASRVTTGKLLDEFEALRKASLGFLTGLSLGPDELALRGLHPTLGPVTLGQLLATWVVHDLNHVGQVLRVMSARYASAVGPWKPYLGILNR
ncbi:MAG TPA: DinB family protein [Vicinamibacteria bacterium]|nr:DinB family protein [Vicinamibacteria bacterium]